MLVKDPAEVLLLTQSRASAVRTAARDTRADAGTFGNVTERGSRGTRAAQPGACSQEAGQFTGRRCPPASSTPRKHFPSISDETSRQSVLLSSPNKDFYKEACWGTYF